MAEIKIRRKRSIAWWPILLALLIPLVWYLLQARQARRDSTVGLESDTRTVPAMVPLPSAAIDHHPALTPPVASSAPPVTSIDVSTPITNGTRTTSPAPRRAPTPASH